MKFGSCPVCMQPFPSTCLKRLLECSHEVCRACLENRVCTLIKKKSDWLQITCPVEGCKAPIHYNDVKNAVENEALIEFEQRAEATMMKKENSCFNKLKQRVSLK